MSDVLTITVPIEGRYPSVNHLGADGFRGGKKTPEYTALFRAVKDAAQVEMERTGWVKASCECFVTLIRYVQTRRRADPLNCAKVEFDALTEAGVWDDDCLANPPMPWIRFDPSGAARIAIVVVKLYESRVAPVQSEQKVSRTRVMRPLPPTQNGALVGAVAAWKPGMPIPNGHADLGGKLVTRETALKAMRGEK